MEITVEIKVDDKNGGCYRNCPFCEYKDFHDGNRYEELMPIFDRQKAPDFKEGYYCTKKYVKFLENFLAEFPEEDNNGKLYIPIPHWCPFIENKEK